MGLTRVLSSGFQVLVKNSGKQTTIQLLDEAGNVVRTRIKSVEKNIVQPKPNPKPNKVGYTANLEAQPSTDIQSVPETIFTITKNDYNHITTESTASILDRAYIDSERVGERIISAVGKDEPMRAMENIRNKQGYNSSFNKVLKFFRNGKLEKENQYEFLAGKRRSRYAVDFELEKEMQDLRTKLKKLETSYIRRLNENELAAASLQKNLEKTTREIERLEKAEPDTQCLWELAYDDVMSIKYDICHFKIYKMIERIGNQTFNSPEEFNAIAEEAHELINSIEKHAPKGSEADQMLEELEYVLDKYTGLGCNVPHGVDGRIENMLESVKHYCQGDLQTLEQKLASNEEYFAQIETKRKAEVAKINNRICHLQKKKGKIGDEVIKKQKQVEAYTKRTNARKANLERQIKTLEARRQQQTLEFDGTKMRVNIDGVDFTL